MKKRFTEDQIIGILLQAEADGVVIRDLCRKHNIIEKWRHFYNNERPHSALGNRTPSRSRSRT